MIQARSSQVNGYPSEKGTSSSNRHAVARIVGGLHGVEVQFCDRLRRDDVRGGRVLSIGWEPLIVLGVLRTPARGCVDLALALTLSHRQSQ